VIAKRKGGEEIRRVRLTSRRQETLKSNCRRAAELRSKPQSSSASYGVVRDGRILHRTIARGSRVSLHAFYKGAPRRKASAW
jgi:hypothetical protein